MGSSTSPSIKALKSSHSRFEFMVFLRPPPSTGLVDEDRRIDADIPDATERLSWRSLHRGGWNFADEPWV